MERVLADAVRRCDAGEAPGCPLIETLSKAEGIGRLIGDAPAQLLERRPGDRRDPLLVLEALREAAYLQPKMKAVIGGAAAMNRASRACAQMGSQKLPSTKLWPRRRWQLSRDMSRRLMNRQPLQLREGDAARYLIARLFPHCLLSGAAAAFGAEALGSAGALPLAIRRD